SAISAGDGLGLIDSGWALAQARTQLESALGEIGHDFDSIRRFLVTHAHRDHYTMAIALRREFGAKVALGIGEQPTIEAIRAGAIDMQVKDLIRWGAQELMIKLAEAFGDTPNEKAQRAYELPDEWITGAVDIELDQRTLHALPTPGHTQGHVV